MATVYKCSSCSATFSKWAGRCSECNEWGTIDETNDAPKSSSGPSGKRSISETIGGKRSDRAAIASSGGIATPVSEVVKKDDATQRIPSGVNEFDRVLGGGLVPGGVTILAGPPGVGKALEINTPILTTNGWKPMGDLEIGESVYARHGLPTKIVNKTQHFTNRPSYDITFNNDETITADENHEWVVFIDDLEISKKFTTSELKTFFDKGKTIYVRTSSSLKSEHMNVKFLANHYSYEVFNIENMPTDFIHAVAEEKQKLYNRFVQDGTWNDDDTLTIRGDIETLNYVQTLARAIGYKAIIVRDELVIYPQETAHGKKIEHTHTNNYHKITNISEEKQATTMCIEVADENHLFLAGESLIPTHNSSIGLAVAAELSSKGGKKILYITGEETDSQVANRALRTGAAEKGSNLGQNLYLLSEQNLQNSLRQTEEIRPDLVVVDSLQALLSENSESSLGSITQVKEVATAFTHYAKHTNTPVILIGQVTKDNEIAGPRVVEHLVDTVLFFESNSETALRLLRVVKNRYGSTDEIGCFEHTEKGLIEVTDPSGFFLNEHEEEASGYASTLILEGVRAIPLEINALTVQSNLANPRRVNTGIEQSRALTIQAVLSKYLSLRLDNQDVYLATAGGLKLKDTATDLAAAAALISSNQEAAIPQDYAFIGELSLTGEIRSPRDMRKRIIELDRLGFKKIFTPPLDKSMREGIMSAELVESSNLRNFVNNLFE